MSVDRDLLEELRTEAIDAAEDRLVSLNDTLQQWRTGSVAGADALATIKLDVHTMKSLAASFEIKTLRVLCHRCEDYLFTLSDANNKAIGDIQVFIDHLAEGLECFVKGQDIDVSQMVRKLPSKRASFELDDVTVTDTEVMLVMAPGTATKIITRELLECGYRMVNVATTMDAIQLIPSMKPDLVLISRTMPELTGIDLANALKSMPTTRDIPVALLSTEGRNEGHMGDLPDNVPILRKGSNFADDVANVFVELGLL